MTNQEFIKQIAGYVQKYAPQYGIKCCSAIIAQAINESGWGKSKLAAQYHNYFGLKCGTKWTGPSVNLTTQEEYQPGTLTTIKDNFRVYSSMEEGVKGYFEFIQLDRYKNLRGITDPEKYLQTIKNDGYATSSTYVQNNMALVNQYNLTQYDGNSGGGSKVGVTAQDVLNVMRSWIGYSEANGKFKQIIDLYNSHKPLARGYAVKYTDEWCDTTVSAAGIKAGAVDLIGTECGCEEHVKIFKQKGIWIEDGAITPQPGDIILFNWDDNTQPNDGYSDHIGFVESVSGRTITTIEGNKSQAVGRRTLTVGAGNIRGYARPKYSGSSSGGGSTSSSTSPKKSVSEIADEVIAGKWGNGDARKNAITAAGYNYSEVQAAVNAKLSGSSTTTSKKSNAEIAKEVIAGKWGNGTDRKKKLEAAGYNYMTIQAEVNKQLGKSGSSAGTSGGSSRPSYSVGKTYALLVDAVRVRTGAGTNNSAKSYSQLTANARANAYSNGCLKKGTKVTCQAVQNVGNDVWIKIPSGWIAAYYGGSKYVG